jgi:asparagine N-glycosylation enzyme membrane subunit Stt3
MTGAFRLTLLWIVGATIMVIMTLMRLGAAFVNGQYIPSNADAFYHARRILDVVMTGRPVQQFDPSIHVPEGSWITWPWAFDSAMAHVTRWFGPFANEAEANRILMHIPIAFGVLFVGVVLVLARQLRLSTLLTALLVIGAAALPVIHASFTVGNLDHHFAEGLWTALTICAGIWFFSKREALLPAIVLGLVLATAVGVHNSLFILQIPVVLVYLLRWLQGEPLPSRRASVAFVASLLVLTIAVCAPSEPWQRGFFEFYTLSWFHTYIAACTAVFCCLLGFLSRKTPTVWLVLGGAALAALPIVGTLGLAQEFMSGQLDSIQGVIEVYSPYQLHAKYGEILSTRLYSWLLWLSAPFALFNAWLALTVREPRIQFFAVAAALGLALLQLQYRFHVFGELALVATPLLGIHLAQQRWPEHANRILIVGCLAFVLLLLPIRRQWTLHWRAAGYAGYKEFSGVFPVLREACATRPGIVLAGQDAGHWVRYHSSCSVIGDAFLLTPQHAAKVAENNALMELTPEKLLGASQPIRYVFAFHSADIVPGAPEPHLGQLLSRMPPLEARLLGPLEGLPSQYKLLWSQTTPAGQTFARLFEISR